jgi:hypothetical protein
MKKQYADFFVDNKQLAEAPTCGTPILTFALDK